MRASLHHPRDWVDDHSAARTPHRHPPRRRPRRRQGSGSPICSGSGPTSTSRSTSASRWPATSSACCPTPTRPTARSSTGASTTSTPRSPTRSPAVRPCTPPAAEVGDGIVTATVTSPQGCDRRLHLQPALRRELTAQVRGAGATSSMVMPSGSRSCSDGLPSSRTTPGCSMPDLGEVIGPPSQRVAVGAPRTRGGRAARRARRPRHGSARRLSTTTTWLGRCCSAT